MDVAPLLAGFGGGVLAGLGAVVPLGAMGVMLLHEGAARGWRRATPAAAGVGIADFGYCVLALIAGSALAPKVSQWAPWPALVGGILLIAVAAVMLRRAARGPVDQSADEPSSAVSGLRRFGLFFGLTAVNPFPLVYFGAIATGLGKGLHEPAVATLFAVGVALASIGWNLVLIAIGAVLHARSTDRIQRIISAVGGVIVLVCGIAVLASAVF